MIPTALWAALAGVLGLAIGSFLNVVIYRVPAGMSILSPPSRCPSCDHDIRNRHNVPVLGWLVLRGRCFDCAVRISPRYPLVEAGTGLLFALMTWRVLDLDLSAALPAYLYLVALGMTLAMIDIDRHRLSNAIVATCCAVLVILLIVAAATENEWWRLVRGGIGAAALAACWFPTTLARAARAGIGEIGSAGVLGAALGYLSWLTLTVGGLGGLVLCSIGALTQRRDHNAVPGTALLTVAAVAGILVT